MNTGHSSLKFALHQVQFTSLERHKLLALAYSRGWLNDHPQFSEAELAHARRRLPENLRRESFMRQLLAEIAACTSPLRVGLLKGPALWGDIYRPGERESCDIDLFVSAAELKPLLQSLSRLGYRPDQDSSQESPLHDFKVVCFSEAHGDLSIEVHTKLWWREPPGFSWHWRPAKPSPLLRLSLEDQLLHLCGHWIAQHTMISMHWLLDIILFMETYRNQIDHDVLFERAKKLRLSRALDLALRICVDFPSGHASPVRSFMAVDVDFLLEPRKSPMRYFALKHAVQESWWDAALYDFNWFCARAKGRSF